MSGRTLRWLMSPLARVVRPSRGPRLTIVRHHRVYRDGERPLYRLGVGERVLRDQVAMLRALQLGPLTVAEGLDRLADAQGGHWVALTFDDGYADNVERALPILAAAGGRASFYLAAGLIEERHAPWWDRVADALERTRLARATWQVEARPVVLALGSPEAKRAALAAILPHLRVAPEPQAERIASLRAALQVEGETACELATWDQAAQLAEAGMEVGAHTLSHPFLDQLDADAQAREIGGSVERIAARLGIQCRGIAYPGGAYDAGSIRAARDAGLAYAVTTRAGDNAAEAPRFELNRRGFDEGMCLGPWGRFSRSLALAELTGAFDGLRRVRREAWA